MELLQLQYFITLAECQHMTRAANTLMISQPSLSNTLSRIEKELGVKLFDRQGRNIVLNYYGNILLQHAKNIFRELDNIHTEIDALKQVQSNTISIGSVDSIYVKDWLPFFINSHPNIYVHHTVGSTSELETFLQNGVIDFAITDMPVDSPDVSHQHLGTDEYIILSPMGNIIPNDKPLDFATFANEPFICGPRNKNILRPIDVLAEAVDIKPTIVFEGEQILLSRIFNLGYGNIITPKSSMAPSQFWNIYDNKFKIFFLTDEQAHFDINLVWDSRRSLSEAAKELINYTQTKTENFRCIDANETDPLKSLSLLHGSW